MYNFKYYRMKTTFILLASIIGCVVTEYGEDGYSPGYYSRNYNTVQQYSGLLEDRVFGGYGHGFGFRLSGYGLRRYGLSGYGYPSISHG